jgi:hypothetical protein
MSTERLLSLVHVPEVDRATFLHTYRPDCVRLSKSLLVRDQRPMPPALLAPALKDGPKPTDWYAFLNGHFSGQTGSGWRDNSAPRAAVHKL